MGLGLMLWPGSRCVVIRWPCLQSPPWGEGCVKVKWFVPVSGVEPSFHLYYCLGSRSQFSSRGEVQSKKFSDRTRSRSKGGGGGGMRAGWWRWGTGRGVGEETKNL